MKSTFRQAGEAMAADVRHRRSRGRHERGRRIEDLHEGLWVEAVEAGGEGIGVGADLIDLDPVAFAHRSEEPTSELQSLMRNSSAVFCWTKKKKYKVNTIITHASDALS